MIITHDEIKEALHCFGIHGTIMKTEILLKYRYSENNPASKEKRQIIRVDFAERSPIVIKYVSEEEHPNQLIEEQAIFSEKLRLHGIVTAKHYICEGKYCIKRWIDDFKLDVTAEDYLGEEVKVINETIAYKIGFLLGNMHVIAEKNDYHIKGETLFNISTKNDVTMFDKFLRLKEQMPEATHLFAQIEHLYLKKLNRVKDKLATQKMYATQGDVSINNLVNSKDYLGVFDFNNAGDCYLISDAILEGILIAQEMIDEEEFTEEKATALYDKYWSGYTEARELNSVEEEVKHDIYILAMAMWMTRIVYRENSLDSLIRAKKFKEAEILLENILVLLKSEPI